MSVCVAALLMSGCANQPGGYGLGDAAATQAAEQHALAEKEKPDSAAVYIALIEQMQQKDMYFASLAHLDQYEHTYGTSPKTTLMRADALRATDQLAASAAAYRSLVGTPFAAQGYRGLGLISGMQGDFDAAAVSLGKAAEASPTDSQALSDYAYALMRSGDVTSARVPIMKAAELDQKSAKVVSNLALYLLADGQVKNANGVMDAQNMPKDVRDAVRKDAQAVASAVHEREKRAAAAARSNPQERAVASNALKPSRASNSAASTPSTVQSVSTLGTAAIQPIDQTFPSQQWRQGPTLSPFPIADSVRRGPAN
jgi:Flp pilus assembly protein TadD